MLLITGLGNPGPEYEVTRHNIGFMLIDRLCEAYGIECTSEGLSSLWGSGSIAGEEVLLLKPQTYMNRSGDAVRWAASELSLEADSVLVAYDDSDLATGRLKLRPSGGSGGHKGVESIISCLGSSDFKRLRLGIGRPENSAEGLSGYVLTPFTEVECAAVDELLARAVDSIELLIREGIGPAMNRFNPVS